MSELTGRGVAAITIGAFGVIVAVNAALAFFAVGSFSGIVVENSYIASQTFNEELSEQRALGWQAEARVEDGYLYLELVTADGRPARPSRLTVTVGRPGTNAEDMSLPVEKTGEAYVSTARLPSGGWRVEIEAEAEDGTRFRQSRSLYVRAE